MTAAAKLLRSAGRRRAGRFLAEGPNLVDAAARRGVIREVFATAEALGRYDGPLGDVPVWTVTEKAARALSDTVTPAGLVAVCDVPGGGDAETRAESLAGVLAGRPRLVAVAVGVGEPGNAGTLIRVSDAMGADAVILAGHGVDPYNGKCLRASAGSIFALPVLTAPDPAALVADLRRAGLRVLATTVDGATPLPRAALTAPTAWLFGAEAHGLAPEVVGLADDRVGIPMRGGAESLNVATAAAICLYQSALAQS